jgi:hypothetical protein
MLMAMSTKANGLTTRLTVTGNTCIIMVPSTLDTGKMISSMVRARKHGQVGLFYLMLDGAHYEGQYVEGKKHGRGKLVFADGS